MSENQTENLEFDQNMNFYQENNKKIYQTIRNFEPSAHEV
jgi:hypothetical protein